MLHTSILLALWREQILMITTSVRSQILSTGYALHPALHNVRCLPIEFSSFAFVAAAARQLRGGQKW